MPNGSCSVHHVALTDRMAWRNCLLRRTRSKCVCCTPNTSIGRQRCRTHVAYFALDGNRFRVGISDLLVDLQPGHNRRCAPLCVATFAAVFHAPVDFAFAIRHHTKDGCIAQRHGQHRFYIFGRSTPYPVQRITRVVDAHRDRDFAFWIDRGLPELAQFVTSQEPRESFILCTRT